jgi:hypothetical protein
MNFGFYLERSIKSKPSILTYYTKLNIRITGLIIEFILITFLHLHSSFDMIFLLSQDVSCLMQLSHNIF